MNRLILLCVLVLLSFSSFSQRKYDFDVPLQAKSNEGVYEWFIEHLDDTCDSLVYELFSSIGASTDSIQWMYPTDLFDTCHKNGWDYYSQKFYFVNDRDKKIECVQKNVSENKLPNSLYKLSYFHKDGITTLYLTEYY